MNGRNNNLNLLRMVAAFMVLLSHSFVLSVGKVTAEPWRVVYGFTPGSVAVEVFMWQVVCC